MNCPNCSTPALAGGLFCTVCGTKLTQPLTVATPIGSPTSGYSPAPPVTSSTPTQTNYASWWRRVLGSLLDGVIVGVPTLILAIYILLVRGTVHLGTGPTSPGQFRCVYSSSSFICPGGTYLHADFRTLIVGVVLIRLVWSVYVILAIAGPRGATFGMRALKIRIVNASDETSQVSKGMSLLRYVAYVVVHYGNFVIAFFGIFGLLDSLWPLWDRRNQTLHDKVAVTVALDVRK